jgi:membrane protease YdiL (CAAX protease family)
LIDQLKRTLAKPLRDAHQHQQAFLLSEEGRRIDAEVLAIMLVLPVALTLQYYGFARNVRLVSSIEFAPANVELARHAYWVFGQFIVYIVIPLPLILWVVRRPWREYGLKLRGAFRLWWVYLGMYLVMVPFIVAFSGTARFQQTYPFYRLAAGETLWPRFLIWEVLYALQFVALEFFFRGFLVHGLKRRFGAYAILIMTTPYCIIHFGKPMPETLGAIIAGLVLGYMSLATRSIWLGAALHIAVAWTMDAAALLNRP